MNKSKRVLDNPFSKFWRVYMSTILCIMSLALSLFVIDFGDILSWGLYLLFAFLMAVFSMFIKLRIFGRKKHAEHEIQNSLGVHSAGMQRRVLFFYLLLVIPFLFLPAILAMLLSPYLWFTSLNGYVFGINAGELLLYLLEKRKK